MMSLLKRIGYFNELDHGDRDGPSIRACLSLDPQQNEDAIVSYLKRGPVLSLVLGIARDMFKSDIIIGAPSNLTDGVYVWPADLPYYVDRYHCRLPHDFTAHMAARHWETPVEGELDLEQLLQDGN